jgi:histidinol-phosphate aminotransferase
LNVSTDQILVGNGAAELIWLVAFAFLRAGDKVLILGPTFGEYERTTRLMNAAPQVWTAQPATGFSFELPEIDTKLDSANYRAVFICNPNNPTGQVLPRETLAAWAQKYPETLFIIDEAYLAFVRGLESALSLPYKNLLILRSMTKDYALAGLRLGYLIAHPTLAEAVTRTRPAWNVNALAQAAGLAALDDESHQRETLAQLQTAKEGLLAGLKKLGYVPLPSETHYFLPPVGKAADFRQKLLAYGILVRDCTSFGLPAYVRIATRRPEENFRLLQTLARIR